MGQRTCPACAEEIEADARFCRHCGEDLSGGPAPGRRKGRRKPRRRNLRREMGVLKSITDILSVCYFFTAALPIILGALSLHLVLGRRWYVAAGFLLWGALMVGLGICIRQRRKWAIATVFAFTVAAGLGVTGAGAILFGGPGGTLGPLFGLLLGWACYRALQAADALERAGIDPRSPPSELRSPAAKVRMKRRQGDGTREG